MYLGDAVTYLTSPWWRLRVLCVHPPPPPGGCLCFFYLFFRPSFWGIVFFFFLFPPPPPRWCCLRSDTVVNGHSVWIFVTFLVWIAPGRVKRLFPGVSCPLVLPLLVGLGFLEFVWYLVVFPCRCMFI